MDFRRYTRCSYLYVTIFVLINSSFGYRNYLTTIDSFTCISTSNFLKRVSCNVDKLGVVNAVVELQKQVDELRMDAHCSMIHKNNETTTLYNYKNVNNCEMFNEPVLNPMLKITKHMIQTFCKLPEKCPIPPSYVFKLSNFSLNTEYLPVYLPECKFADRFSLKNGRTQLVKIEVLGRVIHKKVKTNGRKTSKKS